MDKSTSSNLDLECFAMTQILPCINVIYVTLHFTGIILWRETVSLGVNSKTLWTSSSRWAEPWDHFASSLKTESADIIVLVHFSFHVKVKKTSCTSIMPRWGPDLLNLPGFDSSSLFGLSARWANITCRMLPSSHLSNLKSLVFVRTKGAILYRYCDPSGSSWHFTHSTLLE